jgi:hypothetical protein
MSYISFKERHNEKSFLLLSYHPSRLALRLYFIKVSLVPEVGTLEEVTG